MENVKKRHFDINYDYAYKEIKFNGKELVFTMSRDFENASIVEFLDTELCFRLEYNDVHLCWFKHKYKLHHKDNLKVDNDIYEEAYWECADLSGEEDTTYYRLNKNEYYSEQTGDDVYYRIRDVYLQMHKFMSNNVKSLVIMTGDILSRDDYLKEMIVPDNEEYDIFGCNDNAE